MLKEFLDAFTDIADCIEEIQKVSGTNSGQTSTQRTNRTVSRTYPQAGSNTDALKQRLQEKYNKPVSHEESILDRANKNVAEYEEDEVLHDMESEHKHNEHSKKIADQPIYKKPDNRGHPYHAEDDVFILGNTEDLIAKGYDGNLAYERDFVREGEEFLARISVMREE